MASDQTSTSSAGLRAEPSLADSRLLLADDNQQNRELLEAYLLGEGYTIEMAVDGQETIQKVAEFEPDLILLDIMMPRMSGYEVAEKLKSDDETRTIPILMVTALIDVVLFLFVGEILECYRCHAQYEGVAGLEDHTGFDLEVHEKHRQQLARLSMSAQETQN